MNSNIDRVARIMKFWRQNSLSFPVCTKNLLLSLCPNTKPLCNGIHAKQGEENVSTSPFILWVSWVCVCKIWYYHYARLWLFMYQDWRTNCYYIKTIYQENVTTYYLVVDMRTKRPSSFFLGTQCHDLGLQLSGCSFSGLQNQIKCLMFFLVFWKEERGYCSASMLLCTCTRLSVLGKVYR